MKIKIGIECVYKDVNPVCIFSSADSSVSRNLSSRSFLEIDLALRQKDSINIDFVNKDDLDDNVVIIKKLIVDGIDLQHFIYKGCFTPRYNTEWYEEQKPKPPAVYSPCTELRHSGVWSIDVTTPVWKMMMEEWTNDER